jgi:hypothetical protein
MVKRTHDIYCCGVQMSNYILIAKIRFIIRKLANTNKNTYKNNSIVKLQYLPMNYVIAIPLGTYRQK